MSKPLPTEPGSVIGYSMWYDGNHYMTAVLSWGDYGPAWWRAGFTGEMTHEEMAEFLGDLPWNLVGHVQPAREIRIFVPPVVSDPSWSVDVHDHWDDTPTILKAADEHGMQ